MKNTDDPQVVSDSQKEVALHYMNTLVEVAREAFMILDSDLRVISANPTFYENFQVTSIETEDRLIFELGNGQWNIPELTILLKEILPEKKVVKNYEVHHAFESIGVRTIALNARQIDSVQLIIIAMEDISTRKELEKGVTNRVNELEKEIKDLKKQIKSQ